VTQRKTQRIPSRQVVRYHVLELDGRKLEIARIGTTLANDVSNDGMFLAHAELTPGTHVHFYFELPTGYIEAVGKVVHNRPRADASGVLRCGSGVRFVRMNETDRRRLEAYLAGRSGSQVPPNSGARSA
jgi:hypothetical protein